MVEVFICLHSEDEKDMEMSKHITGHRGTHGTDWNASP